MLKHKIFFEIFLLFGLSLNELFATPSFSSNSNAGNYK